MNLHLPPTTHTVEMRQLHELNQRLDSHPRNALPTAEDLGLTNASRLHDRSGAGLPATATLVSITWQGSPEYPYIHGHFSADGSRTVAHLVELHTPSLQKLCKHLKVRQSWGMGSIPY